MGKPIRILCVEDSKEDAELIFHVFVKAGYDPDLERVQTAQAMKEALEKESWDLILSDYRLPQFSGLAALALLKESGKDIPFIIVSGAIGEETAVEAMRAGANDYVMKSNLQRLAPTAERELYDVAVRQESRKVQQLLKESRMQLAQALEIARLGDWMYDVAADLFTFNDQFYKLFHTTAEEVGGYTMSSSEYARRFVHPDDLLMVWEETKKAIKSDDPNFSRQIDHRMIYADGTIGEISVLIFISKDAKGKTVRTFGVNQDITERKNTENRLRESEAKYRSIVDNAQEGIFQISQEGVCLMVNQAFATMLGYDSPADLIASMTDNNQQIYHNAEDRMKLETLIGERGSVAGFECRYCRKDGGVIWVSLDQHIVRNREGAFLYYEGFCEDITEKRLNLERMRSALEATVEAIAAAVEAKDPYTAGHQRRVADLSLAIALQMGLPAEQIEGLRLAALIHDLGKITVPAEILTKPKKLLDIEFNLIKLHSQTGYDILKNIAFPWPVARIILEHHERMDGSGYPNGLKGDQILLESRILAVSDVVEAMASFRPYRAALGIDVALGEIEKNRGVLYDSDVSDACMRLFREKGYAL